MKGRWLVGVVGVYGSVYGTVSIQGTFTPNIGLYAVIVAYDQESGNDIRSKCGARAKQQRRFERLVVVNRSAEPIAVCGGDDRLHGKRGKQRK
ncbi:hypothetical protein [Cohnella sp. WQ 127256]|uniref:hypothetical protein n=1 Tax=Cohnella sp. WQ 127256 TaxID=2938790 RepID=UPI002119418D|nr:hypothetical protein [Cohnella sp. WQ 127256]